MDSRNAALVSLLVVLAIVGSSSAIPVAGPHMGIAARQRIFDHALKIAKISLGPSNGSGSAAKRSNAELINGLVGMDLAKLNSVGKRSNAELINGLLGMDLSRLSNAGRK